jgi:uncharacterized tellurite resistance protein B-like protein
MEMTPLENLHYALGELAYAVARADGKVQKEEREKFHALVLKELQGNDYDFDVSDIIFRLMDNGKRDSKTTYDWAMHQIKLNSHYLSPDLKQKFISIMEKVADAYPPITEEEKNILDKFKREIEPLNGDPVYYKKR